jgi:hypothetical protein
MMASSSLCDNAPASHDMAQIDDTVFAVLKLSYNNAGDAAVTGGVCGTGFFVGPGTAISAYHVLNKTTFTPNPGYRWCQVWLAIRRGHIFPIQYRQISAHPEFDATVIRIETAEPKAVDWSHYVDGGTLVGRAVQAFGHIGNKMPKLDGVEWRAGSLHIQSADLDPVVFDRSGRVSKDLLLSVQANDVRLERVKGFELSFASRVGMSGGPVVDTTSGELMGMLSIGLPPDAPTKTQTFAISMEQILQIARAKEAAR